MQAVNLYLTCGFNDHCQIFSYISVTKKYIYWFLLIIFMGQKLKQIWGIKQKLTAKCYTWWDLGELYFYLAIQIVRHQNMEIGDVMYINQKQKQYLLSVLQKFIWYIVNQLLLQMSLE